jgi:hypothetical protein
LQGERPQYLVEAPDQTLIRAEYDGADRALRTMSLGRQDWRL